MGFIFLLLSLLIVAGCDAGAELVQQDSLHLSCSNVTLDCNEHILEVGVITSGSWDFEESYEWIDPSIMSGDETDLVVFEISANSTADVRTAIIPFRCGLKKTYLSISQYPDMPVEVDPVDPSRLKGKIIGSEYSVDYVGGSSKSKTVNTKDNAFDGNLFTYFSSYDVNFAWVGLDLGQKHVITKVGWASRVHFKNNVELGLFEGANKPDFSDALPIHIVKEPGEDLRMQYADVSCSRGFRYVRYVSPVSTRCNLAELVFYGEPGEGDDSQLYQLTNIPTVVIHTPNNEEITSKEYELFSNVYIISDDGKTLLSTSNTGVRGRGNSTWTLPKKPYRLKFDSKQSPLGAPASAKKWTLLSNYGDKSLLRNITAFEVSRRVGMSYTPFSHPVDLIINSQYRGNYLLCDQVEAAKGRVEAKDGYLIEIDAYADQEVSWFRSDNKTPVTIKHPDEDDITPEQSKFIADFYNLMENAALGDNFTDPENGYRKYLDLDSFLKNFIVGEFCGNVDSFWSVYMYKDDADGKLFTGPVWDHDLSLENDYRLYPTNRLSDYVYIVKGSVASSAVRKMVTRIVREDPQAKARLIEIWESVKGQDGLASLSAKIDETAQLLDESQQLNFKRWDILDKKVHMNFQALGSYEDEVAVVKDYVTQRINTLDELLRK